MKEKLFLIFLVFSLNRFAAAQTPVYMWAKALSGNVEEIQRSTVVDNAGNVYITGVFFGTVDFDPGAGTASITPVPYGSNAYIAKYDINGNYLWAKNIPIATSYGNNSMAIDASANIYITGYYAGTVDFDPSGTTANLISSGGSNDIYIAKYNSAGNFVWAKSIGSTGDDRGNEIYINAAGNILLTGDFTGTVDFDPGAGINNLIGPGSSDMFLAEFTAAGNLNWAIGMGGSLTDDARDLAVDASGNIFITGYFNGTADFDPGAATASLTGAGSNDIFIAKYDASGNYNWAKQIGNTGYDCGTGIAIDTNNNVVFTGTFNGTVDFDPGAGIANLVAALGASSYFGKFDNNGNYLWVKPLPLNTNNIDVLIDHCDNIFLSGSFLSGGAATIDMDPGAGTASLSVPGGLPPPYYNIFARYDASGNYLWSYVFGRTCYCSVAGYKAALAIDTAGYIYYSGIFNAGFFGTYTVDFDPGAGTANMVATSGVDNTFFAKYDIGCPLTVLPVTLTTFYGESISGVNKLYWATAGELNNDYFELQRSASGESFSPLAIINGAGNSSAQHEYYFTDEAPLPEINYYRLCQVDFNGKKTYSRIISIRQPAPVFQIMPNPAKDQVTVLLPNADQSYTIIIADAQGRLLNSYSGNGNEYIKIDLSAYDTGIYLVMLQSASGQAIAAFQKLIILR